ncbi:GNAT family N-acetyltransferase [Nocardiopsis sediminis]|uniref:GNAT family N-acetyltransferase n=1 Tax=Nocardiopsis sediminis TaxID=1778267 RepID=A0ABV8FE05_9ACTN
MHHEDVVPLSLPPWPLTPPAHGGVLLRQVRVEDADMARELSTDPYVPETGSLPLNASGEEAVAWVRRQQGRHAEGAGFSLTIVARATGEAVGHCGLWLGGLGNGRATAGYALVPSARGRGLATDALTALTGFGWTLPGLLRIELYIEPWNAGSIRVAQRAGYTCEGLLRGHRVIGGRRRDLLLYAVVRPG